MFRDFSSVEVSHYVLKALTKVDNAKSRQGCLLKVQFGENMFGYADCHPWPELGAEPLERQISLFKEGSPTNLIKRALHFAKLDAEARAKGISLLAGLTIPPSHFFVSSIDAWSDICIENAVQEGFSSFKVKIRDIKEITHFKNIASNFKHLNYSLDFNCRLTETQFKQVVDELSSLRMACYEDPFPFDPGNWAAFQRQGVVLGLDRDSEKAFHLPEVAKVIFIKPCLQEFPDSLLAGKQKIIFTSCLDHPLGELSAAYIAAKAYQKNPSAIDLCGLLTHRSYEKDDFSKHLSWKGAKLTAPPGTGFGFDNLLKSLAWKKI